VSNLIRADKINGFIRDLRTKVNYAKLTFMDINEGSNSRSDESKDVGDPGHQVGGKSEQTHACRHGLPRMRVSSLNSLFALIEIVREKNT
jgi:hypothetical protein